MTNQIQDNFPLPLDQQLELKEIHPITFLEMFDLRKQELADLINVSVISIRYWTKYKTTAIPSKLIKRALYLLYENMQLQEKIKAYRTILN